MSKTAAASLYDIHKSYLENSEEGPFFEGSIPSRPHTKKQMDFLGFKVNSPLGVPAGPLLNSRWIKLAAALGYDVICYKTIRSHEYLGHPVPNVVFIDAKEPFSPSALPTEVTMTDSPDSLAITNSFGMPSRSPEYLRQDIALANSYMGEGQVMIVSVVGTPGEGDFVTDFVGTARFAKECGAKIIEANFSCPNVKSKEGSLYVCPESVFQIASQIVKAIAPTPLIIKVGLFPSKALMREVFIMSSKAGVQAISGINTISMAVVDRHGNPALGQGRLTSGVCGSPIRLAALEFIKTSFSIITKEKLPLSLIGCGGIVEPIHFQEFLDAGAHIAQTATGMMWHPELANQYHREHA